MNSMYKARNARSVELNIAKVNSIQRKHYRDFVKSEDSGKNV